MLEYDFLRVTSKMVGAFKEFPLPAIIVNRSFQVYWSNLPARAHCPQLTETAGLRRALAAVEPEHVLQVVAERGNCTIGDLIPLSSARLSCSPIWEEGELIGLVLLLVGSELLLPGASHLSGGGSETMLNSIVHSMDKLFAVMDAASLKAEAMDMGWMKSSFETVGLYGYRILRIADNIVQYNRCQSSEPRLEAMNLFAVLQDLREALESLTQGTGIPLEFRIPEGIARVGLDFALFETALFNVLHNALFYTRPRNRVVIAGELRGGDVLLHVRDRGLGIPAEALASVTRPYHPYLHSSGQDTMGLGLALAKSVMEAHAGGLDIRSTHGRGTQVTLRLQEAPLSQPLRLRQRVGADLLGSRFSRIYTGLSDIYLSPYR